MAREDLGDLGRIIERLDERGRLVRVTSEVDPVLISRARREAGRGGAKRARIGALRASLI